MKKIIVALFLCLVACKNINEKPQISFFIDILGTIDQEMIEFIVDDQIIYNGKFKGGHKSLFDFEMFIGKINKDSILTKKIFVKIGDRDTTFNYSFENVDSLAIFYIQYDDRFRLMTNLDEAMWLYD